ncbi:response regulator [Stutzerimonas urumqiensis]|uniref:response regulator n=1 Tax=Stutzerimonas urumqiensis TaxID=638269 RepID=UPI000EAF1898|nr:response regulator [Stutzerimonas urumqiensis]
MRILLVEDDPILALTAAAVLEEGAHQVVGPAHGVTQALELASASAVDLALVDINLAGRDEGIELARRLRAEYGIVSVFVSGQRQVAEDNRDAALGLLGKPFRLDDLLRTIDVARALIDGLAVPPPPATLELFVKSPR